MSVIICSDPAITAKPLQLGIGVSRFGSKESFQVDMVSSLAKGVLCGYGVVVLVYVFAYDIKSGVEALPHPRRREFTEIEGPTAVHTVFFL